MSYLVLGRELAQTLTGAPRPGFLACRRVREVRRPDSGSRDPEPMSAAKHAFFLGTVGLSDGAA